ncbi:MAG: type II toxin-antitoxin system VapC family toxin [bacterium]|nr:type II toxin-antitoxin system VapC family toxin [bacterium]
MGRIEVILLDTHVWVWWVLDSKKLSAAEAERLGEAEEEGLGVSIMSCWEVARA